MNRGILPYLLLATAACCTPLLADSQVMPVLNHPVGTLNLGAGNATTIPLADHFGTAAVDSQAVRITSEFGDDTGAYYMDIAVFSDRSPLNRANFLSYVTSGAYTDTIVHYEQVGFGMELGAYTWTGPSSAPFVPVPAAAPVKNEFSISNSYGTVSMVKSVTGNADSATSEFLINMGDNSSTLDSLDGGYTVVGALVSSSIGIADYFTNSSDFQTYNLSSSYGADFASMPLYSDGTNFYPIDLPTISLVPLSTTDAGTSTTLTYSIYSNSASTVAAATIQNGSLVITPGTAAGTASILVAATDSVGNVAYDLITVNVAVSFTAWRTANFSATDATNDAISGPLADPDKDGITNMQLFLEGLPAGRVSKRPVTELNVISSGAARPYFTFPFRNDITGATYTIEQSTSLSATATWTTVPQTIVGTSTTGNIDTITLRPTDAVPAGTSFYRLRFTMP